ncbi:hypothetical protein D3C78_1418800 [compost metagenome]
MADHGGEADPGLLLDGKAELAGDQDRQQALEQVAEQGEDGQLLARHPQHVGGAGVAGAIGARVRPTAQAAEQDGEGQRAEQVGEQYQQPEHGIHSGASEPRF